SAIVALVQVKVRCQVEVRAKRTKLRVAVAPQVEISIVDRVSQIVNKLAAARVGARETKVPKRAKAPARVPVLSLRKEATRVKARRNNSQSPRNQHRLKRPPMQAGTPHPKLLKGRVRKRKLLALVVGSSSQMKTTQLSLWRACLRKTPKWRRCSRRSTTKHSSD